MKDKEKLIKRYISVEVLYPKRGNILWTCGKDHIIRESRITHQFDYNDLTINSLKKSSVGGVKRGIYWYPYLKHIIKLSPGGW